MKKEKFDKKKKRKLIRNSEKKQENKKQKKKKPKEENRKIKTQIPENISSRSEIDNENNERKRETEELKIEDKIDKSGEYKKAEYKTQENASELNKNKGIDYNKIDYNNNYNNKSVRGIFLKKRIQQKEKEREEKKKKKEGDYEKKKKKERVRKGLNIKKLLKNYTLKAGIETEPEIIRKKIFGISLLVTFFISLILLFRIASTEISFFDSVKFLVLSWILILLASMGICWLLFFVYIDLLIYRRKVEIENVLADFLQLTSANVRAGMPIDKALWYSVRPRFGVLAKEMETVAKETMSGVSLEEALTKFSEKYDSSILKNSISLLIEGINSGGEVGYILDRISTNIQETQIIKKEMAANVITYVIFITFASILAAPFLMALSYQLLIIINTLGSQMATEQVPNTMGLNISFSSVAITPSEFKIFAMLILSVTAIFSAMIITIIQKGNIKAGLKLIPTYILVSIILFTILTKVIASFFVNLF